jgi:hypothetical protein
MRTNTRTDIFTHLKESMLKTILGLAGTAFLILIGYHLFLSETPSYPTDIDTVKSVMIGLLCVLCLFYGAIHLIQRLAVMNEKKKEAARKDHAAFDRLIESMPPSLPAVDTETWPLLPKAHHFILCKCYDHWRLHLRRMQAIMKEIANKDGYSKRHKECEESASIAIEHLKGYREEFSWSLEAVKEYQENAQEFERATNYLYDSHKSLQADENDTTSST